MDINVPYKQIIRSAIRFYMSRWFVKKWRTESIQLEHSGATMYVNQEENRGRALIILNGLSQPRLHHFWKQAVQHFQPNIAIDVGVNYGECLFSVTYPSGCRAIGIEANHQLKVYIERTRSSHPQRSNIEMVYALASDNSSTKQPFYVNKYWSGISSAVAGREWFKRWYHRQMVQQVSLDHVVAAETLEEARILFKIDVEGYEPKVLAGMRNIVERCPQMLGFMEFDSDYIQRAGYDIDLFLQFLYGHFDVRAYVSKKHLESIQGYSWHDLQEVFGKKSVHTDFIVASRNLTVPADIFHQPD
jgi:FkbM family methyltransferase